MSFPLAVWEWQKSDALVAYDEAIKLMEEKVANIFTGSASETVWLCEHDSIYTIGTSGSREQILDENIPVYNSGRGGKVTYHGPGQRIVYLMLNLNNRPKDLRLYINQLEKAVMNSLATWDIKTCTYPDKVGVWVPNGAGANKIAAIGVRIRKWVTYHWVSINISNSLKPYGNIVPCGIDDKRFGVTTLSEVCKRHITFEEWDKVFCQELVKIF